MAFVMKNVRLEVQSVLATAIDITAISKASEVEITAIHSYSVGDIVVIDGVIGMVEMNKIVGRVKSVSTTVSFVLEGIDSTDFNTYISGGTARKVTTFLPFDNASSFSMPDPAPNKVRTDTIHTDVATQLDGIQDPYDATVNIFSEPLAAHIIECRKARDEGLPRVIRVTVPNKVVVLLNTEISGGLGIDGSAGEAATGAISLTPLVKPLLLPISA